MKQRICVDFDGTIYDGSGIFPGCVATLAELRKTYSIAIFTARASHTEREQMKAILDRFEVPYDEILPVKPQAVIYIDDKGFRFDGDWTKLTPDKLVPDSHDGVKVNISQ